MFRTASILGLGVVFFILAVTTVLFSFRIVTDEHVNLVMVLLIVSLSLAGVASCGVYFARRCEREDFQQARAAAAAALDADRESPPNARADESLRGM